VDIDGVRAAFYFNALVFVVLALLYECLRKWFPSVYASRQTRARQTMAKSLSQESDHFDNPVRVAYGASDGTSANTASAKLDDAGGDASTSADGAGSAGSGYMEGGLPDSYKDTKPFQWIVPILGVSWRRIHKVAGLDAYFFLRYIFMCYRITSVTAIWGMLLLFPVYYTGTNGAESWYHFSMANVNQGDKWRIWAPTLFMYIFSGFVFYVMKNELAHFMELRLDFLGKGVIGVNPQQHYSIMLENIPKELRSDRALYQYFNQLFPGKVHSANVMLHLPELEALSAKKDRTVRRLEKAIARYEAMGDRPTHIMGRPRINCCDIELSPLSCLDCFCRTNSLHDMDLDGYATRGQIVDSIQYYTIILETVNREFIVLQKNKMGIADASNRSLDSNVWFATVSRIADIFLEQNDTDDYTYDDNSHESSDNSYPNLNLSLSSSAAVNLSLSDDYTRRAPIDLQARKNHAAVNKERRDDNNSGALSWDLSEELSMEQSGIHADTSRIRGGQSWDLSIDSPSEQNNQASNTLSGLMEESSREISDGLTLADTEGPIVVSGGGLDSTGSRKLVEAAPYKDPGEIIMWHSAEEEIEEKSNGGDNSNGDGDGDGGDKAASVSVTKSKKTIETISRSLSSLDSLKHQSEENTVNLNSIPSSLRHYGTLDADRLTTCNIPRKRVQWSLKKNKSEGDIESDSSQQSKIQPLLEDSHSVCFPHISL